METATTEPTPAPPPGISPQPLPPIPETRVTPREATPPAKPRPTTPLERTLLELLSDADLGATGFLKANELKTVLLKLGKVGGVRGVGSSQREILGLLKYCKDCSSTHAWD